MHEFYRHYLDLFARMDGWPYADVVAYQSVLLERLARHVRTHVPVFAGRVRPLFDGDTFRLDRWSEVPILTRQELRAVTPALEAIEPPAEMGELRTYSTAGSTGEPVRVRHTALSKGVITCMHERVFRWHGFRPGARMANISASAPADAKYPDGKSAGAWSQRDARGETYLLDAFTPIDLQLEWLGRMQPHYLFTTASNVLELSSVQLRSEGKIDIDALIAIGTRLMPGARETATRAFGAPVIETYNCKEFGPIAHQCEQSDLLHICPEHLIVEVVDDDGCPVGPGATGRVVATSLYNFATPLLRYELGDLAETATEQCVCGRIQPALRRVIGRIRRALVFADGRRVMTHSTIVAAGVPEFVPARQYQIVQTGRERFEIRYVPDGSGRRLDIEALRNRYREIVHPNALVDVVTVESIPLGKAGKYEDFIYHDDRQTGDTALAQQ